MTTPLKGRCPLCLRDTRFEGLPSGDIRERLPCAHCGANARQRAAVAVLRENCPQLASARIYVTEQASTFYRTLRGQVGKLEGGEYGLTWVKRLRVQLWLLKNGILERLHQRDLTNLDYPHATLDAVVSLDVLEHVPDHHRALREVARVLKPGGVFVFTVPFYHDQADSQQVAWLEPDGSPAFKGEPEYHGDPVSGGVLCFHHFGWDLLEHLRRAGFSTACAMRVHSPDEGLPVGQWVMCGRR